MPGQKILIVDDDARNIFALSATLRTKGFECAACSGAPEMLQVLSGDGGSDVGVILIDMMMPDIDGYHAIPMIREIRKDLPVIAVTAQAMAGDRERCLQAGADDYISKPIDVDLLLQSILRLIRTAP